MGPVGPIAVATHQAGGQYGLVWTECATDLGDLPETGAFHAMLANKHVGGSGGEARALAITEPKLAAKLLASVRAKRVADLSVLLDEDLPVTWPGEKPGLEGARYLGKTLNAFDPRAGRSSPGCTFSTARPARIWSRRRYCPAARRISTTPATPPRCARRWPSTKRASASAAPAT